MQELLLDGEQIVGAYKTCLLYTSWSSEEQARFYYEQDQKVLATGKGTSFITEVPREDGTAYYQIKKNPVVLEGKIIGIVGLISDITERVRLEKQAENWAIHDELTGLYNRCLLYTSSAAAKLKHFGFIPVSALFLKNRDVYKRQPLARPAKLVPFMASTPPAKPTARPGRSAMDMAIKPARIGSI